MRWVLIIGLVVAVGGCSLTMNRPSGKYDPSRVPDCSRSRLAPQVDIVVGLILLPLAKLISVMDAQTCEHPDSYCEGNGSERVTRPMVVVGLTQLLLAAPIGFMWAGECRKRHRDYASWMREQRAAPAPKSF